MSIFSKGLVAAMEEEAQMQSAELAIDEAGADSAEADLVEATNISADVEQGVNEVEQAVEDADTLERIAEVAEKAEEEEGGLDPVAAEVMEVAVEAIYARLGIKQSNLPSLESFASRSSRKKATRISVEGIVDVIKSIWAAVANAFRSIGNFLKKMYDYFFDTSKKLLARAATLRAQLAKAEVIEGEVKASGIVGAFGDKIPAGIISKLESTVSEINALFEAATALNKSNEDTVKEYETEIIKNGGNGEGFFARQLSQHEGYKVMADMANKLDQGGIVGSSIKLEIAGKDLKQAAGDTWDAMKGLAVSFKELLPGTDVEKIPALSKDQVGKVIAAAEKIAKANIDKKAVLAKIEANFKNLANGVEKIGSGLNENATDNVKRGTQVTRGVVTAQGTAAQKIVKKAVDIGLKVTAAALTYAERSMKGAKADEKKEEAAA